MKSRKIVFAAPFRVELGVEEFDAAAVPAGKLAVKTLYTLVSPGTDMSCLAGKESWFQLPGTPGYTAVGEVIAAGQGAGDYQAGDRVFFYGGNRQFQLADPGELVLKIPAGVELWLAPFVRLATIAMTAVRVSPVELGDTVIVSGLGPVGNLAAQLAKLAGATVIGLDPSAARRELAQQCGIDFTVDPLTADVPKLIREITGGAGVDAVIEASGLTAAIAAALPLVKPMGDMILLGTPRQEYLTNATAMYRQSHDGACVNIKGASEWRYPVRQEKFVKHSMERNSQIVFDLIANQKLHLKPLLSHLLPPAEAPMAYEGVRTDREHYFGVVFDWTKA